MPSTVLTEWLRGWVVAAFTNQDKADRNFVCLVYVTVRWLFESGRFADEVFAVLKPRQCCVTAIQGTAVIRRAKSDRVAADAIAVLFSVTEDAPTRKG